MHVDVDTLRSALSILNFRDGIAQSFPVCFEFKRSETSTDVIKEGPLPFRKGYQIKCHLVSRPCTVTTLIS